MGQLFDGVITEHLWLFNEGAQDKNSEFKASFRHLLLIGRWEETGSKDCSQIGAGHQVFLTSGEYKIATKVGIRTLF